MKHIVAPALLVALVLVLWLSPSLADEGEKKPNPVVVMQTSMGDIEVELFVDGAPVTVENFIGLAEGTKAWKNAAGEEVQKPFFDGLQFHRVIKGFMIQGGCPKGNGTGDPGFQFKDEINGKGLGLDKEMLFTNKQPHPWILGILDPRNPQRAQAQFNQMVVQPMLKKMGVTTMEEIQAREKELNAKLESMTLLEVYENMGYVYDETLTPYRPERGSLAMANSGPNTNGSQFFINVADTPHLTGKHTVFGKVVKGMDVVDKIAGTPVGQGAKPVEPVEIVSVRVKK